MITGDTLRALLARRSETKNLDYKEFMNWGSASNDEKCQLVKNILAMMNTQDGGQIVVGVQDAGCNPIGVSDSDAGSFDTTKVNDFVHKYTDPLASCQVQKLTVDGRNFVVIDVLEFKDVPIICKAAANSAANKVILKRGGLYIRTDKATSELVSSVEDMRELLSRALLKRGDQLLRTIQALISGKPIVPPSELEAYRTELEAAEEFFSEVFPEKAQKGGHWDLVAMPNTYAKERVPTIATLAEALGASEVSLRGWNFPHTNPRDARNFTQGRQSFTAWPERSYYEALRAYMSGLFFWRASYWDDSPIFGGPAKVLSWVDMIYQITEFFIFLSRYYARIVEDATLSVTIRLTDTNGRVLISRGNAGPLFGGYVCSEPEIEIEGMYSVSQLRASPEDVARPVVRRAFEIFQWTGVRDDLIRERQRQLIERRF